MSSSNQVLKVSGSMDQLEMALKFALDMDGGTEMFTRSNKPAKLVYQITEDGRYCIGWNSFDSTENGWTEFQFDFDLSIISKIIVQFLQKQPIKSGDDYSDYDGSEDKGFMMSAIPESMGDEMDGIKRPFYGIVCFETFDCFYSK